MAPFPLQLSELLLKPGEFLVYLDAVRETGGGVTVGWQRLAGSTPADA